MIPLYPVKTRYKSVPLYSLLSAGKAREMGTKGVPAEIQKPEAVTPKRADSTTLDVYKSVLTLKSCRHQRNNAQQSPTTEDQ